MLFHIITDRYISYLQKAEPNVMSNKEGVRTYHRKYLGVLTELNGFRYFIPLSSPKEKDYKMLVLNELYFVRANAKRIEESAKNLYEKKLAQKENEPTKNHNLFLTLDFKHLEKLCSEF